tara:strand:+ start:274 stop:693 length:420 start_codon:yes stop_codon:yes gene_type:complete
MQTQATVKVKTLDQQFSEKSGIDISIKERGVDLDPVVGMGVTRSILSDSYPYTIIEILKHPKGQTILKIENDSDLYNHDSYTTFKSGRIEKNNKSVHYLIKDKDWVDIKWNEKTRRWNKGDSYYYHSIGQRHYDLDRSL